MVDKFPRATQDRLIIIQAPFHSQHVINFDAGCVLHVFTDLLHLMFIHDTNVEGSFHLERIVRVWAPLVPIVYFLICLIHEVVESVTVLTCSSRQRFRDVVALAHRIDFVGLAFGCAWDVKLLAVFFFYVGSALSHVFLLMSG